MENTFEDLRYIRHSLENIANVLAENINDDYDKIAAQDILKNIDTDLDSLMAIVENYVEED